MISEEPGEPGHRNIGTCARTHNSTTLLLGALSRAQQYRQEAFDLLAQLGLGKPSREKEPPPPEPADLHQLPAGFRIVQCSWDDWRLRELNRQFNKEDAPRIVAKVATSAGSLGLGSGVL